MTRLLKVDTVWKHFTLCVLIDKNKQREPMKYDVIVDFVSKISHRMWRLKYEMMRISVCAKQINDSMFIKYLSVTWSQ